VIGSGQDFTDVKVYGCTKYSFRGSGDRKLINLEWGTKALKSGKQALAEKVRPMEIPVATEIRVWPNPFRDLLSVDFSRPVDGDIRLVLTDLEGKIVLDKRAEVSSVSNTLELSVQGADLRPGVYILNVLGTTARLGSVKVVKF
jgi:hypothetical protein